MSATHEWYLQTFLNDGHPPEQAKALANEGIEFDMQADEPCRPYGADDSLPFAIVHTPYIQPGTSFAISRIDYFNHLNSYKQALGRIDRTPPTTSKNP